MSESSSNESRSQFKVSLPTGTLVILLAILALLVLFERAFRPDRTPRVDRVKCLANLRSLHGGFNIYASEYEGGYPPPEKWCNLLADRFVHPERLRCPGVETGPSNYAMNLRAEPHSAGDVVLLFESTPGWNQYGGADLLTTKNHEDQGCNVLFADGEVKFVRAEDVNELKWEGKFYDESELATPLVSNARRPKTREEMEYWLKNMIWGHQFSAGEVRAATGLRLEAIHRAQAIWNVYRAGRPARDPDAPLLVLPYPGGRHPRIGFLEGAIDPQRETKFSVFTPWDPNSYVVVDVPEAIWSNLGLTYLAHTHVDTIWTTRGIELEKLEWTRRPKGELDIARTLPNGIAFGVKVRPAREAVHMEMWLKNGTEQKLSDLNVQNCVMTKMAAGFAELTNENKVFTDPYVACRDEAGKRWIITAWEGCARPWGNADCPCFHSDPKFPDLEPGQEHVLRGWLSFYEGDDVEAEFVRIEATGWRQAAEAK